MEKKQTTTIKFVDFSQKEFAPLGSPLYIDCVHREKKTMSLELQPIEAPAITMTLQQKFKTLAASAKASFAERDEVVDISVVALLCRQNVFMLGEPGVAKSAIINYFLSSIYDAKGFSILLGAFSTPEQVFGPLDLKQLEQGRTKTVTKGMLPEADIAFVDEIWKASNAILNSLLTVCNERKFYDGDSVTKCPLLTCFSASNELPQSSELAALYDRFAFRSVVKRIASATTLTNLLVKKQYIDPPKISIDEVRKAQEQISSVTVPDEVASKAVEIVMLLRNEGVQISDRNVVRSCADIDPLTGKKALSIIKVQAWLDNRTVCDTTDLSILKNVFWNDPEEFSKVSSIINKMVDPYAAKFDEYKAIFDKLLEDHRNVFMQDQLTQTKSGHHDTAKMLNEQIKTNEKVKDLLRQITKVIGNNTSPQVQKLKTLENECREYVKQTINAVAKGMISEDNQSNRTYGQRMPIPSPLITPT